jgi:hypothetical protein
MCRRVQCEQCQKPTFAGCGKHVEQVLRGVAESNRCQCRRSVSTLAPIRAANINAQVAPIGIAH